MAPDIQKFADMLYEAERTRVPIEPLTDMAPSLTADDAYAISWRMLIVMSKKGGSFPARRSD